MQNTASPRKYFSMSNGIVALAAIVMLFTAADTQARSRWFTARTVADETKPISVGVDPDEVASRRKGPAVIDNGLIDIVISYHGDPAGDNDGNTQGNPGSEEQDTIERIIQYFADGVYESTMGAHRLRNVRIYRNGERSGDADVVWVEREHPHVPFGKGVGSSDGRIVTCDIFTNGRLVSVNPRRYEDKDMLADEEGAGYTLAHEWGHYFYGLYDEYMNYEWFTGVETVSPSIMNSQWNAIGRNYRWLNFSVRWRGGTSGNYGAFENTRRTAQHDIFGESAWETLARPATGAETDWRWWIPKLLGGAGLKLGPRISYPELAQVAPTGDDEPTINLSSATPLADLASRSDLNIIWMSSNIVIQVVIDKSGSMGTADMNRAKEAAKNLVDAVDDGTAVGVIVFDGSVTVLHSISEVNSDADRNAIKAKIDTVSAGGLTAIGDAARTALNGLISYGLDDQTAVVYLLTDGYSNRGVDPLSVIPDYRAAQVPIIGFAYGASTDPRLAQMSHQTGGKYYVSPATMADIQRAFSEAHALVASRASILDGEILGSASESDFDHPFTVDSTISRLRLTVTYTGGAGGAAVELLDPSGTVVPPSSTQQVGGETTVTFAIDDPDVGGWVFRGTRQQGSRVVYSSSARTDGASFLFHAASATGDDIQTPAPIKVVASLAHVRNIDGASVVAHLYGANGLMASETLENEAPGLYVGELSSAIPEGTYSVRVYAGNDDDQAVLTYGDSIMTLPENADSFVVPPDVPVSENFTRVASFEVYVSGMGPILDVTDDVTVTYDNWELDRNTGAMIATVTMRNDGGKGGVPLELAFWFAIADNPDIRLADPAGVTETGLIYADVTDQVEAQLPFIGNGDMKLDIGEEVTFQVAIYTRDRSIPQGHFYAIWADPPITEEFKHRFDGNADGVIDDFEVLEAVDAWTAGDLDDFGLLETIELWRAGGYEWDDGQGKFLPVD